MNGISEPDGGSSAQLTPLFKWPGGKRWLAPALAQVLHAELKGTYYEPFLGAGAVFLHLLPKNAVLGDVNADLIECVDVSRREARKVRAVLGELKNTKACFYQVRDGERPRSAVKRAARFIYLMKTCWGGIYRLNQEGQFNVPYGRSGRRADEDDTFEARAEAFDGVRLICADFEDVLRDAKRGDVVYADPPYTTLGENNGFVRYNEKLFAWKDQERLAKAAREAAKRGAFVAVSGFWHNSVLDLYPGWWAAKVTRSSTVSRTVDHRQEVTEVVIFSRKPRRKKFPDVRRLNLTRNRFSSGTGTRLGNPT